jgi:hypothetical protein
MVNQGSPVFDASDYVLEAGQTADFTGADLAANFENRIIDRDCVTLHIHYVQCGVLQEPLGRAGRRGLPAGIGQEATGSWEVREGRLVENTVRCRRYLDVPYLEEPPGVK